MVAEDFYRVLGVGREATAAEIKKAYRKLAMECHPDRNHGDKECEEKFKKLSEAYACLSDPEKRANYDRFGTAEGMGQGFGGFGGGGFGGGGFGDIFEDVFGDFFGAFAGARGPRRARGNDLRYSLGVSLEEAVFGVEKTIEILRWESCGPCRGSGSRTGRKTTCPDCGGRGQVRYQQGFFSISRACSRCGGEGSSVSDPCPECRGQGRRRVPRNISVKVPAGVDSDSRLKMSGEGEPGANGGPPGDLFIVIDVAPHEFFHREGRDLYCEMPVSFAQAALGAEVEVPTIEGSAVVKIPAGAQPGASFRLKGKGAPRVGSRARGDQVVVTRVEVPRHLTPRQREIIEEFERISRENDAGGFKESIKNFFAGRK